MPPFKIIKKTNKMESNKGRKKLNKKYVYSLPNAHPKFPPAPIGIWQCICRWKEYMKGVNGMGEFL